MSHIERNAGWATISLNTATGHIMCREDWMYHWQNVAPARPWTDAEKCNFHNTVDTQIWRFWSNRLRVRVAGTHEFCRRFPQVRIEFDIRRVISAGHWTVYARKIPRGTTRLSEVKHSSRVIHLDSEDLAALPTHNRLGAIRMNSYVPPHEFGHTQPDMTYSVRATGGAMLDEYTPGTPLAHAFDADSIMNIGRELRPRHLAGVIAQLNMMLPGCTFSA